MKIKEGGIDYVAKEYMVSKIPKVLSDLTGKEVLTLKLDADIERVPVGDDNQRLIGIISIGDVIRGHQTLMDIRQITQK